MSLLKKHSPAELEEIAAKFISEKGQFNQRVFLVEHVLESLGYTIWPAPPEISEIAEAYLPIIGNNIYVSEAEYDRKPSSVRFRFTLTEELAHIIIHRPHFKGLSVEEITKVQSEFTDSEYAEIERDAKYLAGCLLMPKIEFSNRFNHHLAGRQGTGSSDLSKLRYVFLTLYQEFWVSPHAAVIRASQLKLIDQPQATDLIEVFDGGT